MSREILDRVWFASGIRMIGDGVPAGDVMAAQASLTHWDQWFPYWTALGEAYERLAREALAAAASKARANCSGRHACRTITRNSSGSTIRRGATKGRTARSRYIVRRRHCSRRRRCGSTSRSTVRYPGLSAAASRGVRPRTGRDRLRRIGEHQGGELPFREPLSRARTCDLYVRRTGAGRDVFPGQDAAGLPSFWVRGAGLAGEATEFDPARIGMIGRSLGGFYAIHSAAHDPRFKACVCWGVLFDLSYYDQMHDPARRGFAFVAGYDDAEKAGPYLKSTLDLSGQASGYVARSMRYTARRMSDPGHPG